MIYQGKQLNSWHTCHHVLLKICYILLNYFLTLCFVILITVKLQKCCQCNSIKIIKIKNIQPISKWFVYLILEFQIDYCIFARLSLRMKANKFRFTMDLMSPRKVDQTIFLFFTSFIIQQSIDDIGWEINTVTVSHVLHGNSSGRLKINKNRNTKECFTDLEMLNLLLVVQF